MVELIKMQQTSMGSRNHVFHGGIYGLSSGLAARAFNLRLNGHEFETLRPLVLPGSDLGQVTHTYVPLSPSSITWYQYKSREVTAGCGSGVVYHP